MFNFAWKPMSDVSTHAHTHVHTEKAGYLQRGWQMYSTKVQNNDRPGACQSLNAQTRLETWEITELSKGLFGKLFFVLLNFGPKRWISTKQIGRNQSGLSSSSVTGCHSHGWVKSNFGKTWSNQQHATLQKSNHGSLTSTSGTSPPASGRDREKPLSHDHSLLHMLVRGVQRSQPASIWAPLTYSSVQAALQITWDQIENGLRNHTDSSGVRVPVLEANNSRRRRIVARMEPTLTGVTSVTHGGGVVRCIAFAQIKVFVPRRRTFASRWQLRIYCLWVKRAPSHVLVCVQDSSHEPR